MTTVLEDILGLTKLNYNVCRFGDGEPVTLKFADAVGESRCWLNFIVTCRSTSIFIGQT